MRNSKIFIVVLLILFVVFAFAQEAKKPQEAKKVEEKQKTQLQQQDMRVESPWSRFQFRPGEQVISVAAAAFVNADPNQTLWSNDGGSVYNRGSHGSNSFYAPVSLPHGARITRMAAILHQREGGSTIPTVRLRRHGDRVPRGWTDDTQEMINVRGSTAYEGHSISVEDNIEGVVIDNLNNSYYLFAYLPDHCRLKSAKIFYTLE